MSNVMMLPDSQGQLKDFLRQWMSQRQQQSQFEDAQKQQQGQFDQEYGLKKGVADANVANIGASTQQTEVKTAAEKAQGFIERVIKPMIANGKHVEAAKLTQAFIRSNPDLASVLGGDAVERPQLDSDMAAANTQKFAADQTGIAAGGSQDVQARNLTARMATGEQLSAPAFADQRGRQMTQPGLADKGTEYGSAVRVGADLMPEANAKLNANTQVQIGREHNASRVEASGGVAKQGQAKDIAEAIRTGKQPPETKGLYGLGGPVRAELAKQGYDLSRANEDWTATQKYLSTLNGPGQVRLRQAVDFTYESIGAIEKLASEWDAGGFPVLNKARLAVAKQGGLGPEAQSLATRLDSAINDSVSELATVYKGGNASTDEGLRLAAANLKADWSKGTLLDNAAQIKEFLGYRKNSINAGRPVTNEGNQYAPTTDKAPTAAAGQPGARMSKTQTNTTTGEKRTVYSDDGGKTWHP